MIAYTPGLVASLAGQRRVTSLWYKQINGIFVSNQTLFGSSLLSSLSLNLLQPYNAQRAIQARKETTQKSRKGEGKGQSTVRLG